MHLYTVVRVKAESEEEAIELVNGFLEEETDGRTFDYYDEEGTEISDRVKTDEDFQQERQEEIEQAREYLEEALKLPEGDSKAWRLQLAGQLFDSDQFYCVDRLVYDYEKNHQGEGKGQIFFVETDRHY